MGIGMTLTGIQKGTPRTSPRFHNVVWTTFYDVGVTRVVAELTNLDDFLAVVLRLVGFTYLNGENAVCEGSADNIRVSIGA